MAIYIYIVNAYRLAPRVVLVFYHPGSVRVKNSHDVALQAVDVAVQLVFELHHGGLALRVVEEVQLRAGRAPRLRASDWT